MSFSTVFWPFRVALVAATLALAASAFGAPARPQLPASLAAAHPVNVLPSDLVATLTFLDRTNVTPPPTATWSIPGEGEPVLRVETTNRPASIDDIGVRWALGQPLKKGDVCLARFYARTEYARQESGEAMFQFQIQQDTPQWARHVILPLTAGPDWALIEIPFAAESDAGLNDGVVHLSFGTIPQAVEIASLEILNFGNRAKLSDLPQTRFTYSGREADAPWRAAALARIQKIRTAPIAVRVVDARGRAVPQARVEGRLVRPAFIFGTAVNSSFLLTDSPDGQRYRERLLAFFDTAVIENGMKWPNWSGSAEKRTETLRAFDWLTAQGLRQRGHNLVWPADKFSPRRVVEMPAPRAELPLLIKEHIRDLVTTTKGRIVGWDVINEMLHERDYFKFMPETEAAEWFKLARALDPQAKLFINEYAMLNSRGSPATIARYLEQIDRLRAAGAPIDGLGVQGHVGRQVRTPMDVLADLDLLAHAGLEIQITEFEVNSPDEELQADYTRDFLIALYSHPAVTGVTIWGFWEKRHWKPEGAMFRADWSEKPNARVWRDLVRTQWLTRFALTTDGSGTLTTRGHLGDYEFTVTVGEKVVRQMRPLSPAGADITLQIP